MPRKMELLEHSAELVLAVAGVQHVLQSSAQHVNMYRKGNERTALSSTGPQSHCLS